MDLFPLVMLALSGLIVFGLLLKFVLQIRFLWNRGGKRR